LAALGTKVIDSNRSKAAHLFVALPLAASIPGILLTLLMVLGNLDKIEPIQSVLQILGGLLMFLVMALFLTLCILIVSTPIALASYLVLKQFNQLKLWVFTFIGIAVGVAILVAYQLDGKGVEFGFVFGLFSVAISMVSYFALERLATGKRIFPRFKK
jgi:hypothetical protein